MFFHEVISGDLSGDVVRARAVAFCVMTISRLFHSFNSRNARKSLFKLDIFTNKNHLSATGLSLAMQIIIVYILYLEEVFKVAPLAAKDWLTYFSFFALIFVVGGR